MLTVDIDQFLGQSLELGHRRRAAVDPGPAAALAVQAALEQQRFAGLDRKAVFVQPLLRQLRQVELGRDLAARRALAHHAGIGTRAEGELQRIDQDRLAGAGFAGQHGKAGFELQVQGPHDHEIAQGHAAQAHVVIPSFQCSFLRKVSK